MSNGEVYNRHITHYKQYIILLSIQNKQNESTIVIYC